VKLAAAGLAVVALVACGGSSHASSSSGAPAGPTPGDALAARACRMWKEVADLATSTATHADVPRLTGMASAIEPVANQASAASTRWNQLALDLAAGVDFNSAALSDIMARVTKDCTAVPAAASRAAASEPDPFSSTTTSLPG